MIREVTENLEFYGGPFFYQVRFNEPQNETSFTVRVTVGETTDGEAMDFELSRVDGDHLLYRSEEFYILPPSYPDNLLGGELSIDPDQAPQP